MTTETNHHHDTIEDRGRCPDCRPETLALLAGAPRYLCVFPDDNSVAIVRSWAPDDALGAAWATGCNPGVAASWSRIRDEEFAGVPEFELVRTDLAIAAVDQARAAMRDHAPTTRSRTGSPKKPRCWVFRSACCEPKH